MSLASLLLPEGEFRVIRCDIADKLIACGDGDSALLYLYVLRRGERLEEKTAMRDLGFTKERYDRAVFTLTGLTMRESAPLPPSPASDIPKYTAAELRQAREGDHKFAAVCLTAEDTLGRTLTESQVRSLFTIYDHLGLPAEVIIELLSYLKRDRGKVSRRDIEREAALWSDMGIYTCQQAQEYLARIEAEKPLLDAMFAAMHIVGREPSAAERRLVSHFIETGFEPDAVALAVSRMEQNIGKFSLSYLKKILTLWHEKGVHTVAEITALEPESARRTPAAQPAAAQPDKLENWEREWMEEVQRRKRRRAGEE
ncbi:MAG: DnaD domain protein [Butyricicoccus sp.]